MLKKALFLDRDGVINKEKNYLYKIEDFEFIDGIFELCRYYLSKGYLIVIVTNQSGIARGYYSEEDFNILTSWMIEEFQKHDVKISKVYHCPHHPDITGECGCRKPHPGMLFQAAEELKIDLKKSVLIGDHERDIQAANEAGVVTSYFFDERNKVKYSKATKIINSMKEIYR